MYSRQILRGPLVGIRAAQLSCFPRLRRAEVSAIKTHRPVVIFLSILLPLAAAEHGDVTGPSGGGCGEPAVPHHHQEVWFHFGTDLQQLFKTFPLCHCLRVVYSQRPLCTNSDEVRLAEEASKKYGSPAPTIFSKVIDKSIPADIIYEDEKVSTQLSSRISISAVKPFISEVFICLSVFGVQGYQPTGPCSFPGYSKGTYSQNK